MQGQLRMRSDRLNKIDKIGFPVSLSIRAFGPELFSISFCKWKKLCSIGDYFLQSEPDEKRDKFLFSNKNSSPFSFHYDQR